jgi:hypothetical protein
MFAIIDTKGATHIAIHIPKEGCDKSLPAIARMLESNAVFISKGWREMSVVTPVMSIALGDKFTIDNDTEAMTIAAATEVIDEGFEESTPEVLVSNRAAMAKKDAEIKRLQTELSGTKAMLDQTNERIRALTATESDEA